VVRAGVYFDAPTTKRVEVAKGLGARHHAAAAISAKAKCIAVVLSESSGSVRVYCQGSLVLAREGAGGRCGPNRSLARERLHQIRLIEGLSH
jgi:hypothetical protein